MTTLIVVTGLLKLTHGIPSNCLNFGTRVKGRLYGVLSCDPMEKFTIKFIIRRRTSAYLSVAIKKNRNSKVI